MSKSKTPLGVKMIMKSLESEASTYSEDKSDELMKFISLCKEVNGFLDNNDFIEKNYNSEELKQILKKLTIKLVSILC